MNGYIDNYYEALPVTSALLKGDLAEERATVLREIISISAGAPIAFASAIVVCSRSTL